MTCLFNRGVLEYKKFTINSYQCRVEHGGVGRVGFKKSKSILAQPHGAELKSYPILVPPPLLGRANPYGVKWGRTGQVGQGKIVMPTLGLCLANQKNSPSCDAFNGFFLAFNIIFETF